MSVVGCSRLEVLAGLNELAAVSLALDGSQAVLVHLDLGDLDVGGVDTDLNSPAVLLVHGHTLDVDDPFAAVDRDDLARLALVAATHDLNLVVLPDRQRPHVVLGPQRLVEHRRHQLGADVRGGGEVRLPVLPAGRSGSCGAW